MNFRRTVAESNRFAVVFLWRLHNTTEQISTWQIALRMMQPTVLRFATTNDSNLPHPP